MDKVEGQEILMKWFRHNSQKAQSIARIRVVCKAIRNQLGNFEDQYYLYHFLYPLVRIGLIEFTREGRYVLSSTTLILTKGKLISINLNDTHIAELKHTIINSQAHKSILVHELKYIKEIQGKTGLVAVKQNIKKVISQTPSISNLIESYEDVDIYDTKGFTFMNNSFKWEPNFADTLLGCFKSGDKVANNRYLKIRDDLWKKIPLQNINPDSFNWAYCYGRLLNNFQLGVAYDYNSQILSIRNIFFPIIIERILWLNSIDDIENKVEVKNSEMLFKDVSPSLFKQLNGIFMNRINLDNNG